MNDPAEHISQVEFDAARMDLLRRRVGTFGLVLGLLILGLAAAHALVAFSVLGLDPESDAITRVALSALIGAVLIVVPRMRRRRFGRMSLRKLVLRTNLIVLFSVLSQIQGGAVIARGLSQGLQSLGINANLGPMIPLMAFMACVHSAAAIIVPWTVLESFIAPALLALLTLVGSALVGNEPPATVLAGVTMTLAAGLPGVTITAFRSGTLREVIALRLIGDRYAEVSRELTTARRIHEKLFPRPINDGPIRMAYAYEPMRQIGGDYLDAVRHADGSLSITLIDVTGHGITAALAVNRLHGELKRLFAQRAMPRPSEVVCAINDYICLTLADEQVFGTAVAARLSPGGSLLISSAGHPPALLRRGAGKVESIAPTAMMLGVIAAPAYECKETTLQVDPGDLLLLYTDGALESRDAAGSQLGIGGLQEALRHGGPASASDDIERVLGAVRRHRCGPAEDDTLIVAVQVPGD